MTVSTQKRVIVTLLLSPTHCKRATSKKKREVHEERSTHTVSVLYHTMCFGCWRTSARSTMLIPSCCAGWEKEQQAISLASSAWRKPPQFFFVRAVKRPCEKHSFRQDPKLHSLPILWPRGLVLKIKKSRFHQTFTDPRRGALHCWTTSATTSTHQPSCMIVFCPSVP